METILFLLCVGALLYEGATSIEIISSPQVTNWGVWAHSFDRCPEGRAVQGFQLKSEAGILPTDDTALNGIRLYCGNPTVPGTARITSSLGSWGSWRNIYRCSYEGYVNGFALRVESPGIIRDETATNNIRIYCTDNNNDDYIEGDGESFGLWGSIQKCPEGLVVCSIKTQVQPDQGFLRDDTALNNIQMECCPRPST